MSKSKIESAEGRFIYKVLGAMRKETMLDQAEFQTFYDLVAAEVDDEHKKYIFTPVMRAIIRFGETANASNKAVVNQFVRIIMAVNPNISMETIDCFRAMTERNYAKNVQEGFIEAFDNLYNVYQASAASTNRNYIIEQQVLETMRRMLMVDFLVDPDKALEIYDLYDESQAKYFEEMYYLQEKGMMVFL